MRRARRLRSPSIRPAPAITNPNDPDFDAGYCDQDRRHLASLNAGYETPEVGNGVVRALASNWRLSGIVSARSGNRLNITSGVDRAFIGSSSVQRPDQVSEDIYGPGKDASDLKPGQQIDNYFNRAAFALAGSGRPGQCEAQPRGGAIVLADRPGVSRLIPVRDAAAGAAAGRSTCSTPSTGAIPTINFNSGTFGRITTQAGAPRICSSGSSTTSDRGH